MTDTVKFLGATVLSYNSSLGWNDDASRVNIELVQDDDDGDLFQPGQTGYPVYFNFLGWKFYGLLEKWSQNYSVSGNPTFSVSVVDPRQILDGVTVILDNYRGQSFIPNIINAYGYLENLFGFGGSQKNDSGIPYYLLVQTIALLGNTLTPNVFTGGIFLKDVQYGIDLTNLPLLPLDYRVGGNSSMTVMDIIRDLCDAGGCEAFFRMEVFNGFNIIKLYTIPRTTLPNFGQINQFIQTTQGAVAKEAGFELVNDVCAKMVFGGKKTYLFYQSQGDNDKNQRTGSDNYIWPYWGTDLDGRLVIGDLLGYDHQFTLDARAVNIPQVPARYPTSVGELMAAMASYSDWSSFLSVNWQNRYVMEPGGSQIDRFVQADNIKKQNGTIQTQFSISNLTYKHNGVLNPHFMKVWYLGIEQAVNITLKQQIFAAINQITPMNFLNRIPGENTDPLEEIHRLLAEYAEQYYGRKFMVRLPDVSVTKDPDTGKLSFSHLPTQSAFLDANEVLQAQANNLLPLDFNGITDDDNKIYALVRFDGVTNMDFRAIPAESLFFSPNGKSIFVKCEVEPEFVFLDNVNMTSPRAIITLPGIVSVNREFQANAGPIWWMLQSGLGQGYYTQQDMDTLIKKMNASPTMTSQLYSTNVPYAVMPTVAAIPLESQVDLYGPWYTATAIGKTEVEHNESLVPWNYGSTQLMNLAGQAHVEQIGIKLQALEYGSIEYPGIPVLQLGEQLLNSGPYVTDITVNIGVQGVTTNYALKSWSPKFGRLQKYYADKFFKIKKSQYEYARRIREVQRKKVK